MDFALFVLLNAVLFLRPAEVVPALEGAPLYEACILGCAVAALPRVVGQLSLRRLRTEPVTACVLGVLAAVVLSHLSSAFLWGARSSGEHFAKIVLYYLLLLAVVRTPGRLRVFLGWLVALAAASAGLAVAQYHALIDLESLAALEHREFDPVTGDAVVFVRLRATGIFNDPNDLSLILAVGALIGLGFACRPGNPVRRAAWLVPVGFFGYALTLTQSRGGLLALMAGLAVLFAHRFGWKRAVVLTALAVPALLAVAGGRQASISTDETTGQERVQIWREGLALFREAPVFGIGAGQFVERVGLVSHNSFVHCYAELGFVGGTLFFGAFLAAAVGLRRAGETAPAGDAGHFRPFVLAALVAFAVGLLTLSRPYVVPTYLLLGLAAATARLCGPPDVAAVQRFDGPFVRRVAVASGLFFAAVHAFVYLAAR